MSFGRRGSLGRGFSRLGGGGKSTAIIIPGLISAGAGGYTWTGQNAGLVAARTLAATGGSYTYTGQDASLIPTGASKVIAAGAESYAWTGDEMTPLLDYFVTASGGSYAWTGQDATLTATGGSLGLQTDLASFFSLDNTLADSVGAVTDLTNNNSVTFVTSPTPPAAVTRSANFVAASSQYLSHADATGINVAGIDFSIQFWWYGTANSDYFISKSSGAFGSREYEIRHPFGSGASNPVNLNINSSGVFATTSNFSNSAWHHVVITWNNATKGAIIYVDGSSAATGTSSGNPAGTSQLNIGASPSPSGYFAGNMCLFGTWRNRILSASDVTALYNGGAGLSYAAMA